MAGEVIVTEGTTGDIGRTGQAFTQLQPVHGFALQAVVDGVADGAAHHRAEGAPRTVAEEARIAELAGEAVKGTQDAVGVGFTAVRAHTRTGHVELPVASYAVSLVALPLVAYLAPPLCAGSAVVAPTVAQ